MRTDKEMGGAQRGVVVQRKEVARALHIGCLQSIDFQSAFTHFTRVTYTHYTHK